MKYVIAYLHGKTFYLPQDSVLHIEHKASVTKVLLSPAWIVGIMAYQDEPIPVIDVFAHDAPATSLQILCRLEGCVIAYQADSIGNFCDVDEAETQPLISEGSQYLKNIRVPKTEM